MGWTPDELQSRQELRRSCRPSPRCGGQPSSRPRASRRATNADLPVQFLRAAMGQARLSSLPAMFSCGLRVQWEQRRWRETRGGYSSVDFCCLKSCIGTRSRQTTSRAARKQATEYGVTGCLETPCSRTCAGMPERTRSRPGVCLHMSLNIASGELWAGDDGKDPGVRVPTSEPC